MSRRSFLLFHSQLKPCWLSPESTCLSRCSGILFFSLAIMAICSSRGWLFHRQELYSSLLGWQTDSLQWQLGHYGKWLWYQFPSCILPIVSGDCSPRYRLHWRCLFSLTFLHISFTSIQFLWHLSYKEPCNILSGKANTSNSLNLSFATLSLLSVPFTVVLSDGPPVSLFSFLLWMYFKFPFY